MSRHRSRPSSRNRGRAFGRLGLAAALSALAVGISCASTRPAYAQAAQLGQPAQPAPAAPAPGTADPAAPAEPAATPGDATTSPPSETPDVNGDAPAPAPAAADDKGPKTRPVELRHDLWLDGALTVGMAGSLLAWGFIKPNIQATSCTICDEGNGQVNGLDHAFRSAFKQNDIGPAATTSHILSYGVVPATGVALAIAVAAADRRTNEAPLNILLCVEASLVAVIVKEALTKAFPRERPEVHAASGDEKARLIEKGDPLESFPSGHVASIMAITSSAAVIATMRGYKLAPLIWIVGSTLAATSTYLRMAADQHYFTDNLAGAAIGTGVGAAIPLLFHRPVKADKDGVTQQGYAGPLQGAMLSTTPVLGGRVVNVGWMF